MAITVGSVYVDVLPSAAKFAGQLGSQIDPAVRAIGKKIAEELAKQLAKGVAEGVEEGVEEADTGDEAARQGTKTGGKFAESFKRTMDAALRNLPKINVDADTKPALKNVAALREQIAKLSASVDVDVDPKKAIAGLEKLQRELEFILRSSDVDIDVKMDAKAALAEVVKLREEIARSLDRSSKDAGKFARELNTKLTAAIESLPNVDIRINANLSSFQQSLGNIRRELAELAGKRIGIDITVDDAVKEAEAKLARLKAILARENLPVSVRADTAAAIAEVEAFIRGATTGDGIEVKVEPNLGAFNANLKAQLAAIAASIRPIEVDAEDNSARAKIERIRQEIATLSGRIGLDIDATAAQARIKELQSQLTLLARNRRIDIDVRADTTAAVAQLAALRAAAAAAGSTANGHFSRMQLILAAIVALFPLIAAAILALPGLIAAVVGPVGAVALGFEGIKTAAQPLVPLFKDLQATIGATFQQGLNPTINALATLMQELGGKIRETASATINVANGISLVSSSGAGLNGIKSNFDLINRAIVAAGPSLELLTTNLITLVGIGASGLVAFAGQMTQVGLAWQEVLNKLQATGTGQAAVEGLFSVLSSLLGLLAPLTELGAEMAAGFGPALAGAINILAGAFQLLANILSIFPTSVTGVISVVLTLIGVLGILGKLPAGIASAFATMRVAMLFVTGSITALTAVGGGAVAALTSLAVGVKGLATALLGLLLNPVVLAISAVTFALIALTDAQNTASEAAANHESFVSGLASELSRTQGVVTDSTREWIVHSEAFKGVKEAADLAGVGVAGLTDDLINQGPELEALVLANKEWYADLIGVSDNPLEIPTQALTDLGEAAQRGLVALDSVGKGMDQAKERAATLAEALRQQGNSLIGGVQNAKEYTDSIKKIGDEMSTTSDRANGLKTALDILSGRQLSLLEANANYSNDIRTLGTDFGKFMEQIKAGNTTFLDSAGRINVASEAGAKYALQLGKIVDSATQAAAAAFDAAGGVGNLAQSVPAATQKIKELRDIFIAQAKATGLSDEAANKLADTMGLMPKVVTTLFEGKGIPQVTQDLLILQQQMQLLTKDHPITVTALTAEAAKQLDDLGFKITNLPDGRTKIEIEDANAKQKYADFIRNITTTNANIPTDLDIAKIQPALAGIVDQIEKPQTGPATLPTELDISKIQPALGGIVDQITKPAAPPAMPTDLDPAKVPAQAEAIKGTVLTTVANMPVNIIKGSGWDADIAMIRDSVLLIVGNMPINPIKGSGWDADIILIRDSVLLTVATMPINPIKGSGWDTDLALMKAAVAALPYAQMPIDVVKSLNFDLQLAALRMLISAPLPPYPGIPVDVVKSPTFDVNLQALTALITTPVVPVAIPVDIKTDLATQKFNQYVDSIRKTVAVFQVDANIAKAVDRLFNFWLGLEKVVAVFGVDADVSLAIQTLDALFRAIQQIVVPFKVVAVFAGFVGGILGGAAGGIASGFNSTPISQRVGNPGGEGAEVFAGYPEGPPNLGGGGMSFNPDAPLDTGNIDDLRNALGNFVMHAKGSIDSLTPMNKIAAVVPPNTWRVVGDRMTDDEAFIPINNSARSKSILALTASRMGFGLSPMAEGGVQAQQVGAMAPMAAQGASSSYTVQSGGDSRTGDTYNFNITNSTADAYELADEALFRLRFQKFGGQYSGRR